MDWDQAVQTCLDMDSIMVSVHSYEHNEFLISKFELFFCWIFLDLTLQVQPSNIEMYAFWIGLYDIYNMSHWSGGYMTRFQWIDGSLLNYFNWGMTLQAQLEPDYYLKALSP